MNGLMLAALSRLLGNVSEAAFAFDAAGLVVYANRPAAYLAGRPVDNLVGRPIAQALPLENHEGRPFDYRRLLGDGAVNADGLVDLFARSDGDRLPVTVTFSSFPEGQTWLNVALVRDLSHDRAGQELEDQIISLVSHELRTPIGHIMGFSSSLLDPDVEWDASTVNDFVAEIHRQSQRLATLVADLLDMSRIASGHNLLHKDLHRPETVARQALASLVAITGSHHVINAVPEDLPSFLVDGSKIERVLCHLVENAVKYSPPGTTIRVTAGLHDGAVRFCVEDNGPGIAYRHQDRVFERFFRVSRGTPGTGLGLPICKGLVEAHSGRMWLESELGHGCRVCFTLPLT